jgi:hypothetical protein
MMRHSRFGLVEMSPTYARLIDFSLADLADQTPRAGQASAFASSP